ncbi:MAG: hypothetical protein ACO1OB_18420 [Archangium sp.]
MNLRRIAWAVLVLLSACRDPEPTCSEGQMLCAGTCIDTAIDEANCGACGTSCAATERCRSGSCESGCTVSGRFVASGTIEGCQVCDPARSATALSARADDSTCAAGFCRAGACASGCLIGGAFVADLTLNPANACERCEALTSKTAWTSLGDGASCGSGRVCASGTCGAGCFIGGVTYASGASNPANPCQRCEPSMSTTAWSALADGTSCGNEQSCQSGTCGNGCVISGQVRAPGAENPANACEVCSPGTSTTMWSPRFDGAACGAGLACGAGVCARQCFVGGLFAADGAPNPANACEQCVSATSTTAWTARADGFACGAGQVCSSGTCTGGCFIDAGVFSVDAGNPDNACEACLPSASTTSWTARGDGASCGSGTVCFSNSCVNGCVVNGGLVDAGVANPTNRCETCAPSSSTTGYTPRAVAPLLLPGSSLAAQGWSSTNIQPATYTDDGGVITVSTRTNTGASSGGQQLLYTTIGDAGLSYTLRTELRVEAVGNHNQADSAAAIMGAFTPSFGMPNQRLQMAYLDPNSVGWADDTQSAPFGNLDGGFHVYELSVDGGSAVFSVDGVPLLTRANFVTNGVIAIGDQTNDANVDSTIHVRSVSLVCQ